MMACMQGEKMTDLYYAGTIVGTLLLLYVFYRIAKKFLKPKKKEK